MHTGSRSRRSGKYGLGHPRWRGGRLKYCGYCWIMSRPDFLARDQEDVGSEPPISFPKSWLAQALPPTQ